MKKNFPQDLNDTNEYRRMVHWFSPIVLLKTLKKVLTSTLFGQYADRRLVQAALDSPIDTRTLIEKCCGGSKGICGEKDKSEVWVDYVADLGDGFDSTYAIAYLIGQKEIALGGVLNLPRADCLIMGGDEVYPDASRDDYKSRMQRPYRAAFPKSQKAGSSHPPVYLIPGNHDWYDGLTLFLALFCRGRDTSLGSWIASQRRSYFAVHLRENWWIWGFDSQLGEDVDQPQADYFVAVARKMEPNAKVIICASVPTWLRASLTARDDKQRETFYRGLDYIASIIGDECPGAKIPLVLSGDLHHYTRYVDEVAGTNFINAGGGGAFLHPTHHSVEDTIEIKWAGITQRLDIGQDNSAEEPQKAIYPPPEKSRELALGNLLFWYQNWDFCFVLGGLYSICALLMLAWSGYGQSGGTASFAGRVFDLWTNLLATPVFVLIVLALWGILVSSADIKSTLRRHFVVSTHTFVHLVVLIAGTSLISISAVGLKSVYIFGEILYFLALILGMVLFGFLGGFCWGVYLTLVSWFWGDEANGAFSAMRLDSYKHFIRLRIETNKITIYPIGIDQSPKRKDWKFNDSYEDSNPDQDTPAIVPQKDLGQHLIESPIVIDLGKVTPISMK